MSLSLILSNAGPIIALAKLYRLDLLTTLYGQVQIPRAVYAEVVTQGLARGASDALTIRLFWQQQDWPVIETPPEVLGAYQPPVRLHSGEQAVLALAQSLSAALVLLDDEVARAEARRLKLPVRGTLGVLVQAYRQKHLSRPQLELLFQEIGLRPDIWISAKLCRQILDSL